MQAVLLVLLTSIKKKSEAGEGTTVTMLLYCEPDIPQRCI